MSASFLIHQLLNLSKDPVAEPPYGKSALSFHSGFYFFFFILFYFHPCTSHPIPAPSTGVTSRWIPPFLILTTFIKIVGIIRRFPSENSTRRAKPPRSPHAHLFFLRLSRSNIFWALAFLRRTLREQRHLHSFPLIFHKSLSRGESEGPKVRLPGSRERRKEREKIADRKGAGGKENISFGILLLLGTYG